MSNNTYPIIRPLGWGWTVDFDCGSQFTGENGGPLTYQQCTEAIEAWELERAQLTAAEPQGVE